MGLFYHCKVSTWEKISSLPAKKLQKVKTTTKKEIKVLFKPSRVYVTLLYSIPTAET